MTTHRGKLSSYPYWSSGNGTKGRNHMIFTLHVAFSDSTTPLLPPLPFAEWQMRTSPSGRASSLLKPPGHACKGCYLSKLQYLNTNEDTESQNRSAFAPLLAGFKLDKILDPSHAFTCMLLEMACIPGDQIDEPFHTCKISFFVTIPA